MQLVMPVSPSVDDRLRAALAPFALRAAILFGSVARGEARYESDIDVALWGRHGALSEADRIAIIEALALEFGRAVDLVDLARVGEPLLGTILREGRMVTGGTAERGELLSRHLVNQADFVPLQNRILKARRAAWIGR